MTTHRNHLVAALAAASLSAPAAGQALVEAERSALPRSTGDVRAIFVADFNGDGIADLAFGNNSTFVAAVPAFTVMTGTTENRWQTTETQFIQRVTGTADFDSDGDIDLLYDRAVGLNDGTGSMIPTPFNGPEYYPAAIGDFTGDGSPDFVALNGMRFLRHQAGGTFVDETALRIPVSGGYQGSAVLDADGDGDLDLFVTGVSGRELLINQNGIFQVAPANSLPASAVDAAVVATADLNADGFPDLVLGGVAQAPRIYQNQGNGTFADVSAQLGLPSLDVWAIAIGDVDGDLDEDILFGETTGGRLMRQQGGTFAQDPAAFDARGLTTTALTLSDLDNDGDLDLAQGCSGSILGQPWPGVGQPGIEPKVLWNDGSGNFQDTTRNDLPQRGDDSYAAIGDVDGDGVLDLVVAQGGGEVLRNRGDGTFERLPANLPAEGRPLLADLDSDGALDCVLLTPGGSIWSLRNIGTGSFAAWQGPYQVPLTVAQVMDGELGDIDGDGVLDLVVATGGSDPGIGFPQPADLDSLWLGGANGSFTLAPGAFTQTTVLQDIELGDLDGDGDLDAVANERVFLNNSGTFTQSTYQNFWSAGYTTISLADLDGDGDLDIAAGNRCVGLACSPSGDEPANSLHFNDGTGAFPTYLALGLTEYSTTWCVATGDLDNDGDVDIVYGNGNDSSTNDHNHVIWNTGNGTWDQLSGLLTDDFDDTRQIVLGDLDRDGDLDMIALNRPRDAGQSPRSKVYHNRLRQLSAPSPTRIGRNYTLRVDGAPLGAGLWISLQPANIPLTPFGILGLGPAGRSPLALLGPPTGTVAEITLPLPNLPSLVGADIYIQAIDVASLQLSNTLAEQFVNW